MVIGRGAGGKAAVDLLNEIGDAPIGSPVAMFFFKISRPGFW